MQNMKKHVKIKQNKENQMKIKATRRILDEAKKKEKKPR